MAETNVTPHPVAEHLAPGTRPLHAHRVHALAPRLKVLPMNGQVDLLSPRWWG